LLSENFDNFDDKNKIKFISEINRSAKTTFNLLENLLTWAQSQQGEIMIKKENLNLIELVQMAVTPQTPNSRKKNINIEIEIPKNKMILADKYTMSTAIGNLVNNAIKFTPERGKIKITSNLKPNWIEILIEDTGVGMSEEQQNKLFKISEKNSSTLGTNKERGTGLGLILCKEFIEKNGGTIQVKSEIGNGSIFIIKLPIK
jgi:signal transduction histidine kinase